MTSTTERVIFNRDVKEVEILYVIESEYKFKLHCYNFRILNVICFDNHKENSNRIYTKENWEDTYMSHYKNQPNTK